MEIFNLISIKKHIDAIQTTIKMEHNGPFKNRIFIVLRTHAARSGCRKKVPLNENPINIECQPMNIGWKRILWFTICCIQGEHIDS